MIRCYKDYPLEAHLEITPWKLLVPNHIYIYTYLRYQTDYNGSRNMHKNGVQPDSWNNVTDDKFWYWEQDDLG